MGLKDEKDSPTDDATKDSKVLDFKTSTALVIPNDIIMNNKGPKEMF